MIGEIEGIKIYVNNETYTKYKKTLEDEIDELQQQNQKYKEAIDKAIEILDNYQNNLYSKSARKFLDDDIERTITILKEVDL